MESIIAQLAVTFPDLTTLYVVCAIVGGSLLLISTMSFFGGDADADVDADTDFDVDGNVDLDGIGAEVDVDADADIDADVDMDADADVDADVHVETADAADAHAGAGHVGAMGLASWLSVRFLVYFCAVFGILGIVLTYMTDYAPGMTFGVSLAGGIVVGQGVHQLFRKLKKSSSNSATTEADYVNQVGRVSVTITYPQKGEVAIPVRSNERFVPAVAKHPDTNFKVGEEIGVIAYRGGVAEVVSREEFDFLTHKKLGKLGGRQC